MKNTTKEEKYPAVGKFNPLTGEVERVVPGKNGESYTGIIFNGDCRVYKRPVVHQLKRIKCDKEIIKNIKKSRGDLEIARILIEADLMEVLVHVFNPSDARVSVSNYIDEEYQKNVQEFKSWGENNITADKLKDSGEPWPKVLERVDAEIARKVDEEIKKLEETQKRCEAVHKKFLAACAEELKWLEKELQKLKGKKDAVKKKINGLGWN